ncbi:hypothetical protein [Planococcus shixiaomingii]|uniref:hypothetical protein n=1 Tax=Planococcus shixiaomingii TaxID=3058393 RepID=UPI002629A19E|nr:hypothetical protein [Planococcus sp. N022]WKA53997.1 hypothetical protein QWY21_15195 [Planococcus sp. N022]
MDTVAIVVVAYNRLHSLSRILKSLNEAQYDNQKVPLIISIDKSKNNDVVNFAHSFQWLHGEKEVIEHSSRLGLRKHVLFCGNLTEKYDSLIVLEDDIYVSKYFYSYSIKSIEKYKDCVDIAGISLYSHQINVGVHRPFTPEFNGQDAFFLKYAQSWGQIWTRRMWKEFFQWYKKNDESLNNVDSLPQYIKDWSASSWLKYYNAYILENNKYFLYPYTSLTSNFTDSGTHNDISTTSYQVPLLYYSKKEYNLPTFEEKSLKYDMYFENENLYSFINIAKRDLCIDLYASKISHENKRFWLTTKIENYKIIKSFALQLKPHEINIKANLEGNEIFLYDTLFIEKNPYMKKAKSIKLSKIKYDTKYISRNNLIILLNFEIKQFLDRKVKRLKK